MVCSRLLFKGHLKPAPAEGSPLFALVRDCHHLDPKMRVSAQQLVERVAALQAEIEEPSLPAELLPLPLPAEPLPLPTE